MAVAVTSTPLPVTVLETVLKGRGRRARWAAYADAILLCGLLNWPALMILPAHAAPLIRTRVPREVRARWTATSAAAVAGALLLILFTASPSEQVSWLPLPTRHTMIGDRRVVRGGFFGYRGAAARRVRLGLSRGGHRTPALAWTWAT
ncbi:hypothetical protein [Streptomyces sp. NPDC058371]|uniref:hypothetical protein n=1 Tax=Streptomyces sp. NPDC058371 TaxID=3346463 RepID=UPI00364FF16B